MKDEELIEDARRESGQKSGVILMRTRHVLLPLTLKQERTAHCQPEQMKQDPCDPRVIQKQTCWWRWSWLLTSIGMAKQSWKELSVAAEFYWLIWRARKILHKWQL